MREAFQAAIGLEQLTDPVMFERLLHYCERAELPEPLAMLGEAYPGVLSAGEWGERIELTIVEAMAEAMPMGTPEPEALAREALGVFRDSLAKQTVAMVIALSPIIVDSDDSMKYVHTAAVKLRQAFAALGVDAHALLFLELQDRGGSIADFLAGLDTLIDISAFIAHPWDTGGPLKSGRWAGLIRRAELTAGDCLVEDKRLNRAAAARVLTNMRAVHPDLPEVSAEDVEKYASSLEQALRNAVIG